MKHSVLEKKSKAVQYKNCPFCDTALKEGGYWIMDLNYGSIHLNYNQSFLGRCLYIPDKHYSSLQELSVQDFKNLNKELLEISQKVQRVLKANLINLAMLCNKVEHVHWHIIPRYENDQNWGQSPWPMLTTELPKKEREALISKIKTSLLL